MRVTSDALPQVGKLEEHGGNRCDGCFQIPFLGARLTCSACDFDVCGRCFEDGWSVCPMGAAELAGGGDVEHKLERRTPEESRLEVLGHWAVASCEVRSLSPSRREDFFREIEKGLEETAEDRLERVVRAFVEAHTVPWDEDRDRKAEHILEVLAAQERSAEEWLDGAKHLLIGTCIRLTEELGMKEPEKPRGSKGEGKGKSKSRGEEENGSKGKGKSKRQSRGRRRWPGRPR